MTECGPAIQLCKMEEYVCKRKVLAGEMKEGLRPAVDQLMEGIFVCFRNRN